MKTRIERVLQILLAALLLLVMAYIGFSYLRGSPILPRTAAAGTSSMVAYEPAQPEQFVAHGRVVPLVNANLSFPTSGILAELLVEAGDRVTAGQPIARLSAAEQKAQAAAAEGELSRAEAQLADLKAGASAADVAVAQAELGVALATAARAASGPMPEDLTAAEASVAAARAALDSAKQGPDPADVAAANLALQQLKLDDQSAAAIRVFLDKSAGRAGIAKAEAELNRTLAELDQVKNNPSATRKAEADAQVRLAQAQLDLKKTAARPQVIAGAEASVAIARALLSRAQAQVAATELRAPFAGTIAAVVARPGEYVAQGAPIAQLGDLGRWRIETTDLTELDISRVHVGDRATVSVKALPDLALEGTVTSVLSAGQTAQASTVYTVYVSLDQQDSRLNWNMTVSVTFHQQ